MKDLDVILQDLLINTDSEATILANNEGLPMAAINTRDQNRTSALVASLQYDRPVCWKF